VQKHTLLSSAFSKLLNLTCNSLLILPYRDIQCGESTGATEGLYKVCQHTQFLHDGLQSYSFKQTHPTNNNTNNARLFSSPKIMPDVKYMGNFDPPIPLTAGHKIQHEHTNKHLGDLWKRCGHLLSFAKFPSLIIITF